MQKVYENHRNGLYYFNDTRLTGEPHMHKHIEIIYVERGHAVAYTERKCYDLYDGDLFIAFPNQLHYYETVCEGKYSVILLLPELIYEEGALLSASIPMSNKPDISGAEISWIFKAIQTEKEPYKIIALSGYCNILFSKLLPLLSLQTVDTENNSALKSILDYCSNHFTEKLTLERIAEELHLSKYYISHVVNKNLRQSFSDYLNMLRINEACNLLRRTNIKIADISEDVGFGTIRSFNRSFKQIMKMSPAAYRNGMAANLKK